MASPRGGAQPQMSDREGDRTVGYLVKQGAKRPKKWQKRFFVLSGLKLRWYENEEIFFQYGAVACKGEITCGSVVAAGAAKTIIKDARGSRELLLRSDIGCARQKA